MVGRSGLEMLIQIKVARASGDSIDRHLDQEEGIMRFREITALSAISAIIGVVTLPAQAAPLSPHVTAMKAALDAPVLQVRYGRWYGGG